MVCGPRKMAFSTFARHALADNTVSKSDINDIVRNDVLFQGWNGRSENQDWCRCR
jgi:hypothetical protein